MPDPITRNNVGLFNIPQDAPEGWAAYQNANWDTLANVAGIGGLAVQPRDLDANLQSSSLYVKVSVGKYSKADGTIASYPGAVGYLLAANSTTALWLTDAGVLMSGVTFPATGHVRLATVATDATHITSITDERVYASVRGTGLGFALKAGDTFTGTLIVSAGVATLTVNPGTNTVGFFGNAGATQAAAVAALVDSSTGTAAAAIPDVGAAYNQATLNNIHSSIIVKLNALIAAIKRHGLMGP